MNYEEIYADEKNIEFAAFSSADAWEIGSRLVEWGLRHKKILTIRITLNRHVLFQYAFDGTERENDFWVLRKENLVYYTGHSTLATSLYLKSKNQTASERYGLSNSEVVASGGGVPLRLKGTGVVGAVTVSGMSQQEDHDLIMTTLKNYLREQIH